MPSLTCPDAIRKVSDRYKSVSDLPYRSLSALFAVAAFGSKSLCDAVREHGWMPAVSTLDAAMHDFDEHAFMRRLRGCVLATLKGELDPKRFCFAVDDTTVEKFGEFVFARGYHPRHGKSGVMRAQRVIVLALVDKVRGVATPLAFSVCLNKGSEGYLTTQDLCFELVKHVVAAGFPPLPTVVDSGFDSNPLMEKFDDAGWTLAMECRSSRKVKRIAAPNHPWRGWKEALHKEIKVAVRLAATEHTKRFRKTKHISSRRVQLKGRRAPVSAGAVYNRPSDAKFFAVYVSNDLSLSGSDLWELSRARWHLEEAFRALKRSLCFLKLAVRVRGACMAMICVPFALLASIHLEPESWGGSSEMSLGQDVRQFRQAELWRAIDGLAGGVKSHAVLCFRTRRLRSENNKKPVNPSADEVAVYFNRAKAA